MRDEQSGGGRLQLAQRLHLEGRAAEAEHAYRELLDDGMAGTAARHWLGFLLQQQDRLEEAQLLLASAIAQDASHPEWHFNLGMAHARLGQAAAAISAMQTAAELDPGQYFYWTNLGAQLAQDGQAVRAEAAYRQAAALNPACADAFYLLATLLLGQQRYPEARQCNAQGVLTEPAGRMSLIAVGQALCDLGRHGEAQALAQSWLEREPSNPVAAHLLIAFGKGEAPTVCSRDYVAYTFDAAAPAFDLALQRLRYRGPQLVADWLMAEGCQPASLEALDLGCGTGLVGSVLAPYARTLTGVDLSEGMLRQADGKRLYQQLHHADICDFLASGAASYQLICCMDTLIYLGDMRRFFALAAARLGPDGALLFSTERLDEGSGYLLGRSGRYRHHPDYIRAELWAAGLRIRQFAEVKIREEAGCPIAGHFVCAAHAER
ncbi:hypothetical protein BI347_12625 [Chromobacterium sphagni]|uniref:Uncharacterized protein n=1 Tax=Chromobacterium sphagni TaxID=1903179 RepID=A0A1S1X435_9NEIS|nr:tetratricopeptide repeat protein [Chromobacterium sphagni]OHX14251.1 hypothetical protein BI347_12625 [Chromobacterium sphagni]